jgi:hypothetical protein
MTAQDWTTREWKFQSMVLLPAIQLDNQKHRQRRIPSFDMLHLQQ